MTQCYTMSYNTGIMRVRVHKHPFLVFAVKLGYILCVMGDHVQAMLGHAHVPYRVKIYTEVNLAIWLRLVKFTDLKLAVFDF